MIRGIMAILNCLNSSTPLQLSLKPGFNTLGRAEANDFQLADPSVSGRHCQVTVQDGAILVTDLNSTNGTFIDQQPIREAAIRPGQTLRLGQLTFLLQSAGERPADAAIPAAVMRVTAASPAVASADTVHLQAVPAPVPPRVAARPAVGVPVVAPSREGSGNKIGSVIGAVIGVSIGWYCGLTIFIPLVISWIVSAVLKNSAQHLRNFHLPFGLEAGHMVWMLVGGVLTGHVPLVIIDAAVIAAGLVWLWFKPGLGPVLLLSLYNAVAGAVNISSLLGTDAEGPLRKALVGHLAIRLFAVLLLWTGWSKQRKETRGEAG